MDLAHKKKLRSHRPFIVEKMKHHDDVVSHLWAKGLLSLYEKEDITSQSNGMNKARIMLDHLERKPKVYYKFLDALWETEVNKDMVRVVDPDYGKQKDAEEPPLESMGTTPSEGTSSSSSARTDTTRSRARDKNESYPMSHEEHGIALIIDNMNFKDPTNQSKSSVRKGTQHDRAALEKLFTRLGFKPIVHENLSAAEMKDIIKENARENLHKDADGFICAILSHGKEDHISGADCATVEERAYVHLHCL